MDVGIMLSESGAGRLHNELLANCIWRKLGLFGTPLRLVSLPYVAVPVQTDVARRDGAADRRAGRNCAGDDSAEAPLRARGPQCRCRTMRQARRSGARPVTGGHVMATPCCSCQSAALQCTQVDAQSSRARDRSCLAVFSLSNQSDQVRFERIGVSSNAPVEVNNNNSGRKHE